MKQIMTGAKVPHGHWKMTTFVAGLRSTGLTAPFVLDGPMNGDTFLAYVTQFLAPTLKPGDIVVMDNLSAQARRLLRRKWDEPKSGRTIDQINPGTGESLGSAADCNADDIDAAVTAAPHHRM